MTVGGEQSRSHDESCPGNAGVNGSRRRIAGDAINPVNVGDGLAGIVDRSRRERSRSFEVIDLLRELVNLLREVGRFRRSVVVGHHASADECKHAQQSLDKPLPGFDDLRFFGLGIEHERKRFSPAQEGGSG